MLIFADTSRIKCWSQHNHANFLMKIKNSYDSCYIYDVSYPLHNFVFEKLAQTNLLYPQGYDGKIPPSHPG